MENTFRRLNIFFFFFLHPTFQAQVWVVDCGTCKGGRDLGTSGLDILRNLTHASVQEDDI